MPEIDSIRTRLRAVNLDTQLGVLQEIADQDNVTGLTVPVLEAMASENAEVRDWAVEAIKRSIQPSAGEVVDLCQLMNLSKHPLQIENTAQMLGEIGRRCEDPAATASCLHAALERMEPAQIAAREHIVWALTQLGPAALVAKESLSRTAQDASPRLKRLATEALRRLNAA